MTSQLHSANADGHMQFDFPPRAEMKRITLNEARYCQLAGIRCDFLLLTEESKFRDVAEQMAALSGGVVVACSEHKPIEAEVQSFLSDLGIS